MDITIGFLVRQLVCVPARKKSYFNDLFPCITSYFRNENNCRESIVRTSSSTFNRIGYFTTGAYRVIQKMTFQQKIDFFFKNACLLFGFQKSFYFERVILVNGTRATTGFRNIRELRVKTIIQDTRSRSLSTMLSRVGHLFFKFDFNQITVEINETKVL